MRISIYIFLALSLFACSGGGGGGGDCGGPTGKTCESGKFCHFTDLSCGAGDTEGTCEDIPQACEPAEINVCSCEGLTFFNECFANAASQSVRAAGECP